MTTVAKRTFACTPKRDAAQTWLAIVDLLTGGKDGSARKELLAVSGIAASTLADQAARSAPIIATCDGPRTRIYCLYDDDAVEGSDANEDALGFDAVAGDWHVSLPCLSEDLSWIEAALKKHSTRVTARDHESGIEIAESTDAQSTQALVLDSKGFLSP